SDRCVVLPSRLKILSTAAPNGEAFGKLSERVHGPFDARCPWLTAVQADKVTEAAFCRRKQMAGLDADSCCPCLLEKFQYIGFLRQFAPQQEASNGPRQSNTLREASDDGIAHHVCLVSIRKAHAAEIPVVSAVLEEFGSSQDRKRRTCHRTRLLQP